MQSVRFRIERPNLSGRILCTDSTHRKALANKHKLDVQQVDVGPMAYLEALHEAIDEDRKTHGKKAL